MTLLPASGHQNQQGAQGTTPTPRSTPRFRPSRPTPATTRHPRRVPPLPTRRSTGIDELKKELRACVTTRPRLRPAVIPVDLPAHVIRVHEVIASFSALSRALGPRSAVSADPETRAVVRRPLEPPARRHCSGGRELRPGSSLPLDRNNGLPGLADDRPLRPPAAPTSRRPLPSRRQAPRRSCPADGGSVPGPLRTGNRSRLRDKARLRDLLERAR